MRVGSEGVVVAEEGVGGEVEEGSGWRDWRKVRNSASASSSREGVGDVSEGETN